MKCLCVLIVTLLSMNSPASVAQNQSAQSSQTFASFLASFKAAVQSGDREAVASMTKLPFLFEGEELNKSAFIDQFDALFDKGIKKCLLRARPVKDGIYWEVPCVETILMFLKIEGRYKFVEIGIND